MRLSVVSAAVVAALLALSACQDASDVGLGLIDGDASDPNLRTLVATSVDTVGARASTAGFATQQSVLPQRRVLAGRVADPVFGDADAVAYVDAALPATLPEDFEGATVRSVTLELRRDYTYGDTTASLPMEVRFVEGNWSPEGLPADTALGTSAPLATVTVAPTDTVAVFTVPASAMGGRDTVFTSRQFGTLFEGFALRVAETGAPLPGAVAGFDVFSARSRLRVATATDTVTFALSEVYSYVAQTAPAMAPAGVLPVRAGGAAGGVAVGFDVAPIGAVPLARAVLSVPVDRTLSLPGGPFKRPVARDVGVYALPEDEDGATVQITSARVSAAGDLRSIQGTAFTGLVQQLLLGDDRFRPRFELRFATSPASLDILPVVPVVAGGDAVPRLLLTVVAPAP